MKILQICPRVPFPPHDGGAIAMFDIANNLNKKGHEVTVLAINTPKHFQKNDVLNGIAKLETVFIDTTISPFKALKNLLGELPYNFERFISDDFISKLKKVISEKSFDIIQIEGAQVAFYVDEIKKITKIPVVLRSHNLEYQIWKRLAENEGNFFKKKYLNLLAERIQKFEKKYFKKFDLIISITENDEIKIKKFAPNTKTTTVPAGVELDRFKISNTKPVSKSIFILSALNWQPNLEGLEWFLENVWKQVSLECPDLTLHLAGKDTPDSIKNLNLKNVTIHGFVDDASEFMQNYDLMLVPLLSGSGMRLKIIEGMSIGKCILSTSVGAEGIICKNNESIILKNTPEEWISSIKDYYNGIFTTSEIGNNAKNVIEQHYNNSKIIDKFISNYQSIN